jgi:hypothetical protein
MRRKERVEGFLEYIRILEGSMGAREAVLNYSYLSGLGPRTIAEYLEVLKARGLVELTYEAGRAAGRLWASRHPELSDRS